MKMVAKRGESADVPALRARDDSGFSVIEFVVAMSLLVVSILGAARMLEAGMRVSGDSRERVVATNLATQALEQIRGTAADPTKFATSIVVGQTSTTQTVDGIRYTITNDVEWVGQRSNGSNCDAGSSQQQILRATASVVWPNMANLKPVKSTTTLAPPVGVFSAGTGNLAIKVQKASATAAASVPVTAAGSISNTIVTPSDGCAFFAYLAPGTYTVSLNKPGWVSSQEVTNPSKTMSVTVGNTVSYNFDYDQAAAITVAGWSIGPAATGMPVSVGNTGVQPYGVFTFAAGTTSLTPLFPYDDGYEVFAGSCTDADPLGLDANRAPFYPGESASSVEVSPGANTSTTVDLYPLNVAVTNASGTPVSGATVTALANGPTCPAGQPTYGLVATGAAGTSANATGLGHMRITATGGGKTGSVNVWVKPDGTYAVDGSGNSTTLYAGSVPVVVT
jgi:hypothetical protein